MSINKITDGIIESNWELMFIIHPFISHHLPDRVNQLIKWSTVGYVIFKFIKKGYADSIHIEPSDSQMNEFADLLNRRIN